MSSLKARLQNPDYINWVKAGLCLIHTKSGLDDFANTASQSLHQSVLTNIIPALVSSAQPVCGLTISRQNLTTTCTDLYCQGFLNAVIINGIDPTHPFTIRHTNLANCNVGQWHSNHWEVAKLFMNPGQLPTQVNASQTDMSGIINFIAHCKVPRRKLTNVLLLDEVRKARNVIMHTADMKLSASDLQTYSQAMIDLLSDPGISSFQTAQLAITETQTIINAVEFQITLDDEGKVIDQLAVEIRSMAEDMKQKVEDMKQKMADVEECGKAERQAIKGQLLNEIQKVSSCYKVLKDMVELRTGAQNEMEDKVTSLKDVLGKVTKDLRTFEIKLADIEQQQHKLAKQQETCKQAFDDHSTKLYATDKELVKLTTNQETYQKTVDDHTTKIISTEQALDNLRTTHETSRIQTKQDIDEVKGTQEVYQRQTNEKLDELTNTNALNCVPVDEDKKRRLQHYMKTTYKDHLKVSPVSDWASLNVPEIFTPVVLIGDNRKTLVSYKELFYQYDVIQKKIVLLGKAGAGKTTLCKHLTDVWSNQSSKRQFDDVHVLHQYQFLFYVSFRFAEKSESVLDMIKNQLFDDEDMKKIAVHVLQHNPDCCLILMDGYDEWNRSALAKTGRRGDITGFSSMIGVQNCVFMVTSRPWKFFSIPKDEQEKFSRMELDGIKDQKELVQNILQKLEVPDTTKSCTDFLEQIEKNDMSKLMKSPLMLIFAIDIWESERSLPKSICVNFIKMYRPIFLY